jgi:hypothetical protein
MEYVADRLGLIFVRINCPALGHHVTSIDPATAPNSAAWRRPLAPFSPYQLWSAPISAATRRWEAATAPSASRGPPNAGNSGRSQAQGSRGRPGGAPWPRRWAGKCRNRPRWRARGPRLAARGQGASGENNDSNHYFLLLKVSTSPERRHLPSHRCSPAPGVGPPAGGALAAGQPLHRPAGAG